ncbi:MAG TPA: hypothetical protein VNS63_22460 [Blastocatellia bacterium]|nr:hypothetical protein [Blastocatellia bacterium]
MVTGVVLVILALAVSLFCRRDVTNPASVKALRVLFVGNSLTSSNDLPAIVEALAAATGQRTFAYESIALPDFSLEDHWTKKDAQKAIMTAKWDSVVLQQGPSASKGGRALLLEYSRRFAEEIRRAGGRPALYMVWPAASRMDDFKGVSESYRQAAEAVDGLVFPVGEALLNAWKSDTSIALYSGDGFHPSTAASYLAGLVIFEQLYDRSPVGLPSRLRLASGAKIEIAADLAVVLQRAAQDANREFKRP